VEPVYGDLESPIAVGKLEIISEDWTVAYFSVYQNLSGWLRTLNVKFQ
jgi:hypothetical protein